MLSAAAWAIRSTHHTTLDASPGQIVFGRDMIHNIEYRANWKYIQTRKQKLIDTNNNKENRSRISHEYQIGDQVLLNRTGIYPKLEHPRDGPFTITKVNSNGSVRIQKGIVNEPVNIRRLQPYFA